MIYTIDARDNVMLSVMKQYFHLNDVECYQTIQSEFATLQTILQNKQVPYQKLKNALIPVHQDKREIALIFDTTKIEDSYYGGVIFNQLLSILSKETIHSISVGDIVSHILGIPETKMSKIFDQCVTLVNPTIYRHCTQYYVIYINNISIHEQEQIIKNLQPLSYFIGYADMTFTTPLKSILGCCLVPSMVKYKNIFIMPHEDDLDIDMNQNTYSYSFEKYGFLYRSIPTSYYSLFLSYKIETNFSSEEDVSFSLNAITENYQNITALPVKVPHSKLKYLKENKTGIIKKLGLLDYTSEQLESLIMEQIQKNYIYNLEYLHDYNVIKFDVSLELETIDHRLRKTLVSLKYIESEEILQLITMY